MNSIRIGGLVIFIGWLVFYTQEMYFFLGGRPEITLFYHYLMMGLDLGMSSGWTFMLSYLVWKGMALFGLILGFRMMSYTRR